MKKIVISICLVCSSCYLQSQNLVPNSSFECGDDGDGLPNQDSRDLYELICDWYCPNYGTTDVFHRYKAGAETWSSMPHPLKGSYDGVYFIGSQLPRSGNRFAGIITFDHDIDNPLNVDYREYLETKLTEPLVVGQRYCVQFYASIASRAHYASNDLGIYLHNEKIAQDNDEAMQYTPQILRKKILLDSAEWVKIGGTIVATSPYQYLTIGNFMSDEKTDYVSIPTWDPLAVRHQFAYYFIDDVSVQVLPHDILTFIGDTVICSGKQASIQAKGNVEEILWTLLEDTTSIISNLKSVALTPTVTTSYRVKSKTCNTYFVDTVTVVVNPSPSVTLGDDKVICKGDSVHLDAGVGYNKYFWQNGYTGQSLNVKLQGTYSVNVSNEYNCQATDDVFVSVLTPPQFDLGSDVVSCGDFPVLKVNGGNGQQFSWSTGSTDSLLIPTHSGKYSLQIVNQCGTSNDTINIYSLRDTFIPNVVTANNDEKNEQLLIGIKDDGQIQLNTDVSINGQLKIFDRWGTQIFSDEAYDNDWPHVNENSAEGIYYYTFNYLNCPTIKGWVQLIR